MMNYKYLRTGRAAAFLSGLFAVLVVLSDAVLAFPFLLVPLGWDFDLTSRVPVEYNVIFHFHF